MSEDKTPKALVADAMAALGLTVESVFVPFSNSRNAGNDHKSLNWKVSLLRQGRPVLTCDYSAGVASCPGYAVKAAPVEFLRVDRYRAKPYPSGSNYRSETPAERLAGYRAALCAAECESGFAMRYSQWGRGSFETIGGRPGSSAKLAPIKPDSCDVMASLVLDSSVLDSAGFEDWAAEFGYDTDSRSAEAIYRACLEHALALRAAIGDSGLEALKTALENY